MRSKLLFIIDPLPTFHFETDTTFVIMAEAQRRGHEVWTTTIDELMMAGSRPTAPMRRLNITNPAEFEWQESEETKRPLDEMELIFMRKDPPFNMDYIMATYILSLVDEEKTLIFNKPSGLREFSEKMGIFLFPELIPETIVAKKKAELRAFQETQGTIVLKTLDGFAGSNIFVLHKDDKNRNVILETMTRGEQRYVMAQRFLPEISQGDRRVLVLNGEILGVHNRLAAIDDYRSNISAGGRSAAARLSEKEEEICLTIAQRLRKLGIVFAGIDLIGTFVTEINVTSPTGLVLINSHEGVHLEAHVLDFFEQAIAAHTA